MSLSQRLFRIFAIETILGKLHFFMKVTRKRQQFTQK